jgi:hypothetical protein
MSDWEDEMDRETTETQKTTVDKLKVIQESEDIIKPKVEIKVQKNEPKLDDYEKKWQDKNKDLIERKKKDELALEGLDEKEKQKKIIDKRIIDDASDFLDLDKGSVKKTSIKKEEVDLPLVTEKDFIDLAVRNVSKIKGANKPSKLTHIFLKHSIELLGPTLDGDKLDMLIKDLTVMFNKKRKEESEKAGKKPASKAKPSVSAGKGLDRAEKMGAFEDFGLEDEIQEDDYDQDDFI